MFNQKPIPKGKEGCEIEVKRDSKGNIKKYSSNGKCSSVEVQQFKESVKGNTMEDNLDDY